MNDAITGLELTCREIIDFVMSYLDRELPERERAIFEAHLALCRDCRNYLASYQATLVVHKKSQSDLAANRDLPEIPDDLVQAILSVRKATM